MTEFRRSAITLTIFLVVALLLSWFVFVTLQRSVTGRTHSYTAVFTDVSGLREGDDVRVAGVRVGRVNGIELDQTVARVDFEVQADQTLYENTIASVTYQNIIGQRYLGLLTEDGEDPSVAIPVGAEIGLERTEPSFDIAGLLNGFEPLFSVLDPDQVQNVTDTIILALQGDSGSLTALIAQTSELATSLTGSDDVLGEVIDNLGGVTSTLAGQSENVATMIEGMGRVFTTLQEQQETFIADLEQISGTMTRASAVFGAIDPHLTDLVAREPGFTGHMVTNAEKFAYLFYNIPLAVKGLARMSQESTSANAYLCNVGITIVPGLSHLLPDLIDEITPGGKSKQSAKCR